MRSSFFIPLIAAAYASAHGFVSTFTVDGKPFTGNVPNGAKNPSVVRQISDVRPVKGADNPAVNCGLDAGRASLVADVNPGSVVTFDWTGGDGSNWPHNTGPMMTYMASCGSNTCDKFDSNNAKWFKIQQVGRKSRGQEWAQADLMNGAKAIVTIPPSIAPGNYLIRHEILSLHLGTSPGGAEFYPSCTQLRIGGNGNGKPSADELVSLPGAYSDNDPGILVPNVFDANADYDFPGPAIAQFVSGAGGGSGAPANPGSGSGNNGSPSASTGSPKPTSTQGSSNNGGSSSGGSCHLKKKPTSSANVNGAAATGSASGSEYRPRHISRIMRGLVFGQNH